MCLHFQIEEALVEKRKKELLEQYVTPEFMESLENTGKLLGVDRTGGEVEYDEDEQDGMEVSGPMEAVDEQHLEQHQQ